MGRISRCLTREAPPTEANGFPDQKAEPPKPREHIKKNRNPRQFVQMRNKYEDYSDERASRDKRARLQPPASAEY